MCGVCLRICIDMGVLHFCFVYLHIIGIDDDGLESVFGTDTGFQLPSLDRCLRIRCVTRTVLR